MHRKFILPLFIILSVLSCKTAPESQSAEETAPSSEIPGGQTVEDGTSPVQPAAEEKAAPVMEDQVPAVEETVVPSEEPPVKEASKTGGMKLRPAEEVQADLPPAVNPEVSPEETLKEESPITEEPPVETPSAEVIPDSTAAEPLIKPDEGTAPEDLSAAEAASDTVIMPESTVQTDLPSDSEENSYNPLLPVVIIPGSDALTPEAGQKQPEVTLPAGTVKEPSTNSPESGKTPEMPIQEAPAVVTTPISGEEYTLASDASGKLIITLEGAGWIYLSSTNTDGITLRDKSYDPGSGRTRFVFSGPDLKKDFELFFLKQDLLRGESEQKSLSLNDDNNPLLAAIKEGNVPSPEAGQSDLMTPAETGSAPSSDTPLTDSSPAAGQTETLSGSAEAGEVKDFQKPVIDPAFPPVGMTAAQLLLMAERYENPGPGQSLEKAILLYEKIRTDFPVTEERFIAEDRIRYLNKHYFKVQ